MKVESEKISINLNEVNYIKYGDKYDVNTDETMKWARIYFKSGAEVYLDGDDVDELARQVNATREYVW